VAGCARQRGIFLEALALPQVVNLVGDMIFLLAPVEVGPEVLVQRLARPITERRPAALDGVAVALAAKVHLPIAREERRFDNMLAAGGIGVRRVKGDVLGSGAMTALAGNAEDGIIAPVAVLRAGHMLDPGVVTFQAARRGDPGTVTFHKRIKRLCPPALERMKPGHGQLVEPIAMPGEIDLVGGPTAAVDQIDRR
jgi:hypothetical protein